MRNFLNTAGWLTWIALVPSGLSASSGPTLSAFRLGTESQNVRAQLLSLPWETWNGRLSHGTSSPAARSEKFQPQRVQG